MSLVQGVGELQSPKEPHFICGDNHQNGCGLQFAGEKTFQNHIRRCVETTRVPCCICDMEVHPRQLRSHLLQQHQMQCHLCNQAFQRVDKLNGHIVECKRVNEELLARQRGEKLSLAGRTVECKICRLIMPTAQLGKHSDEVHKLHCTNCQRTFARPSELQKHISRCNGRIIKCPFGDDCVLSVNQVNSNVARQHLRDHLGTLICNVCNEDFECEDVSVEGFVKHWLACKQREKKLENTTPAPSWHKVWQSRYPTTEENYARLPSGFQSRRVDVMVSATRGIEFQHSVIESGVIYARNHDYKLHGLDIMWLVDGETDRVQELSDTCFRITFTSGWRHANFFSAGCMYLFLHHGMHVYRIPLVEVEQSAVLVKNRMTVDHFVLWSKSGLDWPRATFNPMSIELILNPCADE